MKKILMILSAVMMSLTMLNAGMGSNYGLKHANPMPNLMRIAMGNAEVLNISKDQMISLHAWGKEHRPKMMMMVKQVMKQEHDLLENALTKDVDIMKKAEATLTIRRNIMKMKTECRVRLREILTKKQYAQVVSIYRSAR